VAGQQGIQGPAGVAGATGPQGPAASLVYASISEFPVTGSATGLYLDESTSRLFQWESPVYVEVGTSGGGIATTSASDLTSGTLADARLSSAIALHSQINTTLGQAASVIDSVPRTTCSFGVTASAGQALIAFFTPTATITVSQIAMSTGTGAVAAGLTLARMGIYTYTDGGTATLVARTASDTSLFAANNTTYTRSLSSDGYPANYTLNAGTRYGVAYICVGTTQPQLVGRAVLTAVGSLSPRLSGSSSTSLSDLPTSFTPNTNSQAPFARLS
jgi:hypothetical protein